MAPLLVVSGPSGCGKSTLAEALRAALAATSFDATVILLQQDRYFTTPRPASYWDMENKDTPDAVDMAAIRRDVRAAVASDATLCILEGFLLLHDDELMAAADGVLFLRASLDACLGRRLARSERSAHEAEGCKQYYHRTVWPEYERWTAPALERLLAADAAKVRVLDAELPPPAVFDAALAALDALPLPLPAHTGAHAPLCLALSMCAQSRGAAAPWADLAAALKGGGFGSPPKAALVSAVGALAGRALDSAAGGAIAQRRAAAAEATTALLRLLRNGCAHGETVQLALLERGAILPPLRRLLDGVCELLAADATDEPAAPLLACGRTAAQLLGNLSVNCVKAQAVLWAEGPPLIEKLCELPMASMRELLPPALMALHNCTHVLEYGDARLRLLLGDGSGDAAEAAATTWEGGNRRQFWWLIGSLALLRADGDDAATVAEWPLLLLRSILLEGLWAPLVGAAGALGPAARLEVHRVVEGLISDNEEGRAWREQWFAEGIGEKLGVPVVEALVPLLASAEDQAWWTPDAGAAAPPPRCAELVCLLRTAAALAKDGAAPFLRGAADDDDDAGPSALGAAPPASIDVLPAALRLLERMAVWRPPRHSQVGVSGGSSGGASVDTLMAEREAMRLVALMVGSPPCPAVQARVRALPGGLRAILARTAVDERLPQMREWANLALKALVDGCEANVAAVAEIEREALAAVSI
jgi:uridine kinase